MWARRVRHRAEIAATRATRGWRGLTCGPVLSVGGARAERELGGEAKQGERSVGERAAGDARGLASAGGGESSWAAERGRGNRAAQAGGATGPLGPGAEGKGEGLG